MKPTPVVCLVLAALLLGACEPSPAVEPRFEDFARRFAANYRAGDVEALMGMFHWHGVPGQSRAAIRRELEADVRQPLAAVSVIPLANNEPLLEEYANRGLIPNMQPQAVMVVRLRDENRTARRYLVGTYVEVYIVGAMPPR